MELLAPHLPFLAFALVLLFITLYAVLSSIEFGTAVFLALPTPPISREAIERYFGPAWESTNVFLVFSLVGLVMFFPKILPYLAGLYAQAGVALLFFVTRVLGIFGIFYADTRHWIFRGLFALGSLGAPLALSGIFYVSLTGMHPSFPPTTLLLAIWVSVVSAILMLAAAFVVHIARAHADTDRLGRIRLAASGFFILAAAFIVSFSPPLIQQGLVPLATFLCILFAIVLAVVAGERGHPLAAFVLHAIAVAALIWGTAIAHMPFLIYPVLTIESAFTAPEMFLAMLAVIPFGLLFAVPAIALLWHLYARSPILER